MNNVKETLINLKQVVSSIEDSLIDILIDDCFQKIDIVKKSKAQEIIKKILLKLESKKIDRNKIKKLLVELSDLIEDEGE